MSWRFGGTTVFTFMVRKIPSCHFNIHLNHFITLKMVTVRSSETSKYLMTAARKPKRRPPALDEARHLRLVRDRVTLSEWTSSNPELVIFNSQTFLCPTREPDIRIFGTFTFSLQYCEFTGFWWGNLRERDHWRDPDVDGRIILRWIFRKWEGAVGTGWSWLRIGTSGGHLWVRWGTFGFQKCGEFLD